MKYAVEKWEDCRKEMEPILPLHWEEVAGDKHQIKLNPWWEGYDALSKAGELQIVTARSDEGELVGYHWSIIRPHLHYRQSLTAFTDIYFLRPEYRRGLNGVGLFKAAEVAWRARGVQKAYTGSKVKLDMSKVFEHLGWRKSEISYVKLLEE